jgi:hypothetical protein
VVFRHELSTARNPELIATGLPLARYVCPWSNLAMLHSLLVWVILRVQHAVRVLGVAFFVLAFVAASTRSGTDWFHVLVGTAIGLFFGLVFVFGARLSELELRARGS